MLVPVFYQIGTETPGPASNKDAFSNETDVFMLKLMSVNKLYIRIFVVYPHA